MKTLKHYTGLEPDRLILFIILAVSLSFTPSFMHPFGVLKFMVLRYGVLLFLVAIPLRLRSIKWGLVDVLLFIWLVGLAMSSLVSTPWPQGGFKAEGVFLSTIFYMIARTSLGESDKFPKYAIIIILPAILQASIGVFQYLNLFPPTSEYLLGYESQVFGTIGGANVLGAFLAASLPFVYYVIQRSFGKVRYGLILSLLLILTTLILTKSRGAWVATIVGLFIYKWDTVYKLLETLRFRRTVLVLLVPITVGIAALLLVGIYKLNPDSASGRLFIWSVSWDMFRDQLWTGVGFGNFGLNWLEYQGNYFANSSGESYRLAVNLASAHSQYLHLLAETGIIGLGVFLTFTFSVGNAARMGFRRLDPKQNQILITLLAALATLLSHAFVDDVLRSLIINLQFLLILSMIVSMLSGNRDLPVKTNQSFRRWSRYVLLLLLIPLGMASWHKVRGETLWKQGQDLAREGSWDASINKYNEAQNHLPHSYELEFFLGAAYSKTGEAKKAIELIKSSQTGLSDKNQYIALGKAYIDNGDYALAEKTLNQVLYYYPGLLYPHFLLSRVYFEQGYTNKTISELKIIVNTDNVFDSNEIELVKAEARAALIGINNHIAKK